MAPHKSDKDDGQISGPETQMYPGSPMNGDRSATEKSGRAFRTIGEVSELLDLPQHVLRFWETRFTQIKPLKRGGNRRYYRPGDIDLLRAIKILLYDEGITIKGVQKRFREHGAKAVVAEVGETAAISDEIAAGSVVSHKQTQARASKDIPLALDDAALDAQGARVDAKVLEEILTELKALRTMLD